MVPAAKVSPRQWTDAQGAHIDVRGLPPPEPLVAILAHIDSPDARTPLIVHHERDPVMLYPELAERGWGATRLPAPDGEVRLRLEPLA